MSNDGTDVPDPNPMRRDGDRAALDRSAPALALASGVAVAISNASGPAVSDDGVGYRAVAESLNERGVLGYFLEPRLTTWPPLWPRSMAVIDRLTPLDATGAAVALNVVAAIAGVLLFAAVIRPLVHSAIRRVTAIAAVAFGSTQILFGHLVNTDYAMTVVFLALFLVLRRYRRSGDVGWLFAAAVIVWVGFGIRYASMAAIPIIAAWIPLETTRPLPTRLAHAAAFAAAAAVFPAGVMWRNHGVDGTLLGVRSPSERGLAGNTFDAVSSVGNFLAPGVSLDWRTVWAAVAVLGGLAALAAAARALVHAGVTSSVRRVRRALATPLGFAVMWAVGFGVYLLAARTTTAFDRLNFRLLHPLWCPLVVIGVVVIDRLADPYVESDPRWRRLGATLWWGWVTTSIALGLVMVAWFATGPDVFSGNYERAAWAEVRSSPLLEGLGDDCVVYSNVPSGLYPAVEAAWTPRERVAESTEQLDELDRLEADPAGDRCIAWVDLEPRFGNLATLEEIGSRVRLVETGRDGNLTVYRVEPR